jgi:hypothetical protein
MTMRIKIVQLPPVAGIDGIRLDSFHLGRQYEVGNSLGALMLAEGWAEPVPLDAPKPIEPFSENDPYDSGWLHPTRSAGTPANLSRDPLPPYVERDIAADMFRFRRLRPPKT